MRALFKNFLHDQDGAVTVDFVVLTAAIVGISIMVGGIVMESTSTVAESQGRSLADRPLGTNW
jgi:Flp pilus assembly pilin Flp